MVKTFLAAGIILAAFGFTVFMQPSERLTPDCTLGSADERVSACSAEIAGTRKQELPPVWLYDLRGNAYLSKQDYDDAISDYTQSISMEPDTPEWLNDRAVAYLKKGDLQDASSDADKAVSLSGGDKLIADKYIATQSAVRAAIASKG